MKAQCKETLRAAGRQREEQERALRRELDAQTKLVRRLEADKRAGEERLRALEATAGAGQKRIRELEAGAAGDEWTRECDKVWPVLYKAVAPGLHSSTCSLWRV